MRHLHLTFTSLLCALALAVLPPSFADDEEPGGAKELNDPRFHAQLRAAAKVYKGFGSVDTTLRWAPTSCFAPIPGAGPAVLRLSRARPSSPHGRKVYHLYARDRSAYRGLRALPKGKTGPAQSGQVIVKESFEPVPVEPGATPALRPTPLVRDKDGSHYSRGARRELFVMLELGADTPGTDRGWIYGTLSPDGREVTSAGRVASCMDCHKKAPHGPLFGLPATAKGSGGAPGR
jgi:hypothetical protein